MRTLLKVLLGAISGIVALWIGWGLYIIRTTERVPYQTLCSIDGVELRRYPELVLVETAAPNRITAFRRLFRYISGANQRDETVAMTAPVATRDETPSMTGTVRMLLDNEPVHMTAPVRTEQSGSTVVMAFYLPAKYTLETAPSPIDPAVKLRVEPSRTVAIRRFSWYATNKRVRNEQQHLLDTLAERDIATRCPPAVLQYNDPWTPPFMRRNEVEVAIDIPDDPEIEMDSFSA